MTKIYGSSDDIVYFEGDIKGQVNCYGIDDREYGVLVVCSDGSILEIKYSKSVLAIWEVKLLRRGSLFDRIESCTDKDASVYSDIAYFKKGLKTAYTTTEFWSKVGGIKY